MDDYTPDFRSIFDEVSEEQFRKDPRLIIPYMRDIGMAPIIIRVVETMIIYSKTDFITSIACSKDHFLKSVDRIASNTFVDKDVLIKLLNMMRDARGLDIAVIQPVVQKSSPVVESTPRKTAPKHVIKPVVKTVACRDPKTGWDVMKAEDGSAYYSTDLKKLIRCDKKTTVLVMPDSVECIDCYAFDGCHKLCEIYFPESMTTIDCNLEDCCLLNTIHIPDTVVKLECGCFKNCISLVNVELPSSLMIIADNAFEQCSSLTEITIPESVISVKNGAFEGCVSLEKVTILGINTVLNEYAFDDCDNLKNVYLSKKSKASKCWSYCNDCTIHKI